MIHVGVAGAAGRMGRALVRAVQKHPALTLGAAWEKPGHDSLGQDAGVVAGGDMSRILVAEATAEAVAACKVIIDFTTPEATMQLAHWAAEGKCAAVIGTTGLTDSQRAELQRVAGWTAIVYATNYSTGVNVLWALARQAAALLGDAFDAEIIEAHHNQKKDAPSGTAWTLLAAVSQGKGLDPQTAVRHGRQGLPGARNTAEIGMHAVRAGDIVGDHTALFAGPGERLEIRHMAHSRDVFAGGAVRAAAWIAGRTSGWYSMNDVLGIPA